MGSNTRAKNTRTAHFSIVDGCGNAISMTTSVESPFGNSVMVRGFFLNNQLTDFSFAPNSEDGSLIANCVEPNKHPRSSMSPTIVLDGEGRPELLTGSPGGSMIIGFTAQSILNHYDYDDLDPQSVVNLPRYQQRNEPDTYLEPAVENVTPEAYNATRIILELEARNHSVTQGGMARSGLAMVRVFYTESGTILVGGADPRRGVLVGGFDASDGDSMLSCNRGGGETTASPSVVGVTSTVAPTPGPTASPTSIPTEGTNNSIMGIKLSHVVGLFSFLL
mmetsp:Transcript_41838/g.87847  ORF Transcript_41838/g.87847 Transcript_41838/m.87847 type:complete len:278 (-) Transcript_41838:224-1057(-)